MSGRGGPIDMSRFVGVFLEEAAEHLVTLERGLVAIERAPDAEQLNAIFRAVHSIKGAAAPFGFADVARLAHALETPLAQMRSGQLGVSPAIIGALLRGSDVLRTLLDAAAGDGVVGPDIDLERTIGELAGALVAQPAPEPARPPAGAEQPAPGAEIPERRYRVDFHPAPDLFLRGVDPVLILRELARLARITSVEVDAAALPDLEALDPEVCYLRWRMEITSASTADDLARVFEFVEDGSHVAIEPMGDGPGAQEHAASSPEPAPAPEAEPGPAPAGPGPPPPAAPARVAARGVPAARADSIRVQVERVDRLMNLVGELVIAQSIVRDTVDQFTWDKLASLQEAVLAMERNTRELQERVLAIRMVPIGGVFARCSRLVRDSAATIGKRVSFEVIGEDTELDKTVVERFADPLTHLVRNAVDHGIEDPDQRAAAGKPPEGRVRLVAYHLGGSVVIEVSDDGQGLDTERIRSKAIALGLLGAADVASDADIHAFIFHAGFSTASQVTDLSGRGVGMDVVRSSVEALAGTITIDSQRGVGVRFRIALPLTLAILDGICVGVAGQLYVLPLASIVESVPATPDRVRSILGRGEMLSFRGQSIQLLRVARILKSGPDHAVAALDSAAADASPALVVVVEVDGRQVGLAVDAIHGQSQVVVKSLEANYTRVDGLMGATILGDGRIALILDMHGLVRLAASGPTPAPASLPPPLRSHVLQK
jgi:two-component system chemotaxis sensor kinase CheA